MDVYGKSAAPEVAFHIDDLLDLSSYDHHHHHHSDHDYSSTLPNHHQQQQPFSPPQSHSNYHHLSSLSADDLCVPIDDVAELEWLSHFVDDSYSDIPTNTLTAPPKPTTTSFPDPSPRVNIRSSPEYSSTAMIPTPEEVRRCAHCASEKTPQWRAGPSGPKTLCNACGVRYKSGRLVPEYRPAASPTFVLTQHSNSHRKVMELRRQKGEEETEFYHHHRSRQQYHKHDFEVC